MIYFSQHCLSEMTAVARKAPTLAYNTETFI